MSSFRALCVSEAFAGSGVRKDIVTSHTHNCWAGTCRHKTCSCPHAHQQVLKLAGISRARSGREDCKPTALKSCCAGTRLGSTSTDPRLFWIRPDEIKRTPKVRKGKTPQMSCGQNPAGGGSASPHEQYKPGIQMANGLHSWSLRMGPPYLHLATGFRA